MSERIPCLVPFCGRTTKPKYPQFKQEEWICGKHWRSVNKKLKRRHSRAKRKALKNPSPENINRCVTIWHHCKDQAVGRML